MISLSNVSFTYSPGGVFEKVAIENINLTINKGEFCGLIGRTGSGKTTLVQLMAGLEKPTSGQILVNGLDISDKVNKNKLKGVVGLVFQYPEYQLFGETVFEDVSFGPMNMGLSEEEIKSRAENALKNVGISEDIFEKSPFELSGGQKRRVAIAGVLAMEPKILILDEPTAGLDPVGRDEILHEISRLHREKGITVILVSHSMEDIAKVADRIIVMGDKKVCMDGTPSDVFSKGEELQALGLNVPQISLVISALRDKGINLPCNIYTVDRAKSEILKLLEGRCNA